MNISDTSHLNLKQNGRLDSFYPSLALLDDGFCSRLYRWNESGLKLTSRESSRRVREVCDSDETSRHCLERLDLWPFHHLRGLHDGSFPRLSPLDQLEFITLRIASLPVPDLSSVYRALVYVCFSLLRSSHRRGCCDLFFGILSLVSL